jgi:hypothetical protein
MTQRAKLLMGMKNMAGDTIDAILATPAQEMLEILSRQAHYTFDQRVKVVYGKLIALSRDKLHAVHTALLRMQEYSMAALLAELLNEEQCDGE